MHIPRSYKQDSVDASVVLGVIGDLGELTPDDLTRLRDQTKLGDVDLDHGTCDNGEGR